MRIRHDLKMLFYVFVGLSVAACMPTERSVTQDRHALQIEQALSSSEDGQGSITSWGARSVALFSDAKAMQVGDLVTVEVVESTSATRNLSMKKDKSSSRKMQLNSVLGIKNLMGAAFDPANALDISNSQKFNGAGSTANSDSLKASVTAVVTKRYPNGNMEIIGRREVTINHQPQELTFSGVIRPQDLTPDNTILSSKVAQVKIRYGGGGELASVAHEGWANRFLDFIWPF
ncbi:MAG: flagellar basal body L-ring protein FlgH [Mariprofundaceae bacterium]